MIPEQHGVVRKLQITLTCLSPPLVLYTVLITPNTPNRVGKLEQAGGGNNINPVVRHRVNKYKSVQEWNL